MISEGQQRVVRVRRTRHTQSALRPAAPSKESSGVLSHFTRLLVSIWDRISGGEPSAGNRPPMPAPEFGVVLDSPPSSSAFNRAFRSRARARSVLSSMLRTSSAAAKAKPQASTSLSRTGIPTEAAPMEMSNAEDSKANATEKDPYLEDEGFYSPPAESPPETPRATRDMEKSVDSAFHASIVNSAVSEDKCTQSEVNDTESDMKPLPAPELAPVAVPTICAAGELKFAPPVERPQMGEEVPTATPTPQKPGSEPKEPVGPISFIQNPFLHPTLVQPDPCKLLFGPPTQPGIAPIGMGLDLGGPPKFLSAIPSPMLPAMLSVAPQLPPVQTPIQTLGMAMPAGQPMMPPQSTAAGASWSQAVFIETILIWG